MTDTDWPYDARQDDPLTPLRIPVVGTTNPRWSYLIALCINENPDSALDHGLRPTDAEAKTVRSAIDYQRSRYREGWVKRVLDVRPLDIDGGYNTVTLIKRGEGDWAFRRSTWDRGPHLVPATWMGQDALDLPALLDKIHGIGDTPFEPWERWKTEHPEAFGSGQ